MDSVLAQWEEKENSTPDDEYAALHQGVYNTLVQFTMYRKNVSFNFFGDLQNYTFLESLEPTEPEK